MVFSIVLNDVFLNVGNGVGFSLLADDGAMWKRGGNVDFNVRKLQDAISKKWKTDHK